jgi:hypothetical protein
MRRTALLALLAFAAGSAGGYLASRRPPPGAPPAPPASPSPAPPAGGEPDTSGRDSDAAAPAAPAAVRGVRGRVLLPEGVSRADLSVRASAEEDPGRTFCAEPDPTRGYRYALTGLPPGRYLLTLAGLGEPGPPVVVSVAEGMAEQDLSVFPPAKETVLLVRALGPDGRPVPVRCVARWALAHPDIDFSLESLALADGSCIVVSPPAEWRSLAAICRVASPAFGGRKIRVPAGWGGEVAVEFEEPAFLLVTIGNLPDVLTREDCDLYDLSLTAADEGDAADQDWRNLRGQEARFGPVQPGPYDLRIRSELSVDPGGHTTGPIARVPVRLAPGENRVTVPFPPLFSLTVALPEGALQYDDNATLEDATGTEFCDRTTEGDSVTFRGLPAGRYVFEFLAFGRLDGRMEVTVPSPDPVAYRPSWPDALEVRLLGDPDDGTSAAPDLREGDIVVAVGGKTFANAAEGRALLELAAREESVPLTLLRGSDRLEVRVPGAILGGTWFDTPLRR